MRKAFIFPYPIAEIGGAVPSALKKSGWISSRNNIAGAERLARRFYHPLEVAWLEKNGYSHFCKLWAYKESYVKYTGVGLIQGMDYFSVISPSGILTGVADVCQQLVAFQQDCHMVVTAEHRQAFSLQPLEG